MFDFNRDKAFFTQRFFRFLRVYTSTIYANESVTVVTGTWETFRNVLVFRTKLFTFVSSH
jgi:hypothetical protein